MSKSIPSEQERRLVAKLVRLAPKLPRAVVKLLTGAAHRCGFAGPQTLPTGDGNMSGAELRALAEEIEAFCRTAGWPLPTLAHDRLRKIAIRLDNAAYHIDPEGDEL